MSGLYDDTLGKYHIVSSGQGVEGAAIYVDVSNEISTDVTIPTHLHHNIISWQGQACFSAACLSAGSVHGIRSVSICSDGPALSICVGDVTIGVDDENSTMQLVVWGW